MVYTLQYLDEIVVVPLLLWHIVKTKIIPSKLKLKLILFEVKLATLAGIYPGNFDVW